MNRVVITGAGLLCSGGVSAAEYWENLVTGGANITEPAVRVRIPKVVSSALARRMDRLSNMALTVASLALQDSGLMEAQPDMERIGTVFNTVYGALASNKQFLQKLLTAGPDLASPMVFASTVANACVGHTCMNLGLKGPSTMLMGSSSVGYGLDILRAGRADGLLAGGVEEYHPEVEVGFRKRGFSDNECTGLVAARPFDRNRRGIGIREAAVMLMMENADYAQYRHAKVLAEVAGYGGAYSHVSPERAVAPIDPSPFVNAMRAALEDAGVLPAEVDLVVAAAGGSLGGDLAEARAIHDVFAERASALPVMSNKGLTGETFGAASTLGVATGALILAHQRAPATMGYTTADPEVNLNIVVGEPLGGPIRCVLVNGFDMGGNVASVLLRSV